MKWKGHINFDSRPKYDTDDLATINEIDTISGSLNTKISAKPDTLLELSDTPAAYSTGLYLKSTTSGTEWATASGGGGTSNHSELNELDYVSAGHTGFQPAGDYATDSELTTLSGSLQTNIDGKSDTGHTHTESDISDLDKYTEAEVDTISGSLNTKIDGKADIVHMHDDRYYTESEVDTISGTLNTKIDGKSDTGHTHTESDISDLDKYTQGEIDTISGTLQTNIDGKSDTSHIHDDRYYTESEVDDLITTISGKLDDHNELNNLDYASSGHTGFQPAGDYLTDSEFSTYSGTLQLQIDEKSDAAHLHDDRYYTESEVDTISGSLQTDIDTKSNISHLHDDRYYTESEVDTISGTLQTDIDGKSDTSHIHDDRYYTESEVNTISGSLNTKIDGKADTVHTHDDRYYTESEVDTISGTLSTEIDSDVSTHASDADAHHAESHTVVSHSDTTATGANLNELVGAGDTILHKHDGQYYTESEVDTISGSLSTKIGAKPDTLLELSDTPAAYDENKYLKSTIDGTEWATVSGGVGSSDHSELSNLAYADSGHTGFASSEDLATTSGTLQTAIDGKSDTSHTHDDRYYTEGEVDTISGSLSSEIDSDISTHASNADAHHSENHTVASHSDTTATGANLNELVGSGDTTLHKHDTLYYTEAEVDTISGSLNTKIDGKADTSHTHDDRYYTESETDTISGSLNTKIDGKADTSHTHDDRYYTETELNNGQLDNRYYTESETDTISGSLNTKIDGKSDTVHFHDDRYYTESEVDTISGTLSSEIDSDIATHTSNSDAHHAESHTVASHSDTTATGANLNELVGSGDTALHKHDDRYYTESEVDTISGSLQTNIDGKADTSHTHDDRYYTETELDSGQLDNRYYTESEVDTISGSLQTNIDGKSDTGHTHVEANITDLDKYTQAEVDAKWTTWSGTIDHDTIGNTHNLTTDIDHDQLTNFSADEHFTKASINHSDINDDEATKHRVINDSAGDGATTELWSADKVFDELATKSDTGHSHTESDISDLDKYTQSEVDTISGSLSSEIDSDIATHASNADVHHNESHTVVSHSDTTATGANLNELVGAGDTTLHKHDGQYYTESEVDTISGSLNTKIDGKADTSHTHDDRYYTETELNNGQLDNRYYTESEVDTISGSLSSEIDSDISTHASNTDAHHSESHTVASHSDTTATGANLNELVGSGDTTLHKHDGQYYTESEIDTISGSLNTKIDGKDNYTSWSFAVDGETKDDITAGDVLDFVGGDNITITRSADDQITISGIGAGATVSDTVYGAGWNGVTTIAPSKNAVYDEMETKLADVSEDTTPDLGGQLGVGEYDIKFDALLSADGKYSGSTRDGVLGATLAYGDLVYLNTTDQRWEKASANAEITSGDVDLALVLAAGNDGDTKLLLTDGYVREDDWNFTSYGKALYVSTVSGTMTQTVVSGSGDIVRTVGKAGTTADQIYFKPGESWVELS